MRMSTCAYGADGKVQKNPIAAALLDDKWELYDTRTDFSLANDLSAQNPPKLKELQDLFMKEAGSD